MTAAQPKIKNIFRTICRSNQQIDTINLINSRASSDVLVCIELNEFSTKTSLYRSISFLFSNREQVTTSCLHFEFLLWKLPMGP